MAGDSKGPIGHPDHVSERTIAITGGDAGYFDLLKDCVGSRNRELHELALKLMEQTHFDISTAGEIAEIWRRKS